MQMLLRLIFRAISGTGSRHGVTCLRKSESIGRWYASIWTYRADKETTTNNASQTAMANGERAV